MKVIGVTGGVGAGKSEVLGYIAEHWNATVVEADEVGYLVMRPGKACYSSIVDLFGTEIVKEDQTLDRELIAKIVFENKEENETNIFIVEAALLIEDKYDEICDELWYIYADEETRMERLKQNRGYSEEKCRSIFRNQLSEEEFSDHCDFEIDNSDDFEKTKDQIQQKMQRMQIDEVM